MIKMITKSGTCVLLACAVWLGGVDAAYAQRPPAFSTSRDAARQTFNFTLGTFIPRAEDKRVEGDVLVANLDFPQFLAFDVSDFRSFTAGFEWLFPIGQYVEVGPGISFSKRTVPTVYSLLLDEDLSEIEQDMILRVIPISFTARVLPLSQSTPVQPYVGAGFSILNWRYQETGEFVRFSDDLDGGDCTDDFDNCRIFEDDPEDPFEGSGHEIAPVFLVGVRFANQAFAIGGEAQYRKAEGDLPEDKFFGTKIDLGGWTAQATIGFRF